MFFSRLTFGYVSIYMLYNQVFCLSSNILRSSATQLEYHRLQILYIPSSKTLVANLKSTLVFSARGSRKRKTGKNVGPLMNEVGALVVEDTEKAELLTAFFASVFTAKAAPHESQTLETREKVWREEDFPSVGEDWVRDHLAKLDIHKSMGPDRMHPQVLRELADVIAGPLSIIFERSWKTGEVPEDWRKANIQSSKGAR
ncbi:rna-directed dna polymerase from mobile element jockey-like [Limosa lapponica baueri]|uniref:Rna-directed dna polymerase from mobile element jockey-like n=1 Tax=Limosa lapponica baueri TaxID=1758121 RepID=A0A2I0UAU9_LIMLA|nr:rna-directed dna polymerase from mobile element jockey-like [Limosa lapponica baueri]